MPMRYSNYRFNAEDCKVYFTWVRRTIIAYGAFILFSVALVAIQAMTHTAPITEFAATALPITAP